MIVIADTSPLNYLVLIGEQELLPALFGKIIIPEAVFRELQAAAAPQAVQNWSAQSPKWLDIRKAAKKPDRSLTHLDEGEREAIQLAEELGADLLLVDEKAARREAFKRHLSTSGTLGVLDRAAEKELVDFSEALQGLKQTSFYLSFSVERFFLERDRKRKADRIKPQS
jgi:predicted nucleic acid-binding protein